MSYTNEVYKISDCIFAIEEVKNIWKYLIIGKEYALLIDTGYGFTDLKAKVRELTELPLIVVNTHGDIDHVCGNYLFDDAYISIQDFKQLPGLDNLDFKRSQLLCRIAWEGSELLDELDTAAMREWLEHSVWETRYHVVEDGHVFDLGGRSVKVITIPGHTPGSIALLDSQTGFLFSGDTLISAVSHFLVSLPQVNRQCEPLPILYHSLKKLKSIQAQIKAVYPAHGEIGLSPEIIDDVMLAAQSMYNDPENNNEFQNWTGTYVVDRKIGKAGIGIEWSREDYDKFSRCPLDIS